MEPVQSTKELAYRVRFTGHSGHLAVDPLYSVERRDPINSLPDFVLPPAHPRETRESLKERIEETYLLPRLDADEFSVEKAGRQWDFDWFKRVKIPLEPSLPRSVIIPKWELPFRRLSNSSSQSLWIPESVQTDVSDIYVGEEDCITLPRPRGSSKDSIRASLNNRPFRPGGLEESQSLDKTMPYDAVNGGWIEELLKGGPAQCVAPIIKDGLPLGDLEAYPSSWVVYKDNIRADFSEPGNMNDVSLQFDDLFKSAWSENVIDDDKKDLTVPDVVEDRALPDDGVTELIGDSVDVSVYNPEAALSAIDGVFSVPICSSATKSDQVDDGNDKQKPDILVHGRSNNYIAENFHQLVPDMALTYPFELDSFQKEAIYYIERGESVFVAAHTSAGKTVVAEYAFALASKHFTRAIYTAPIKTISNQKYRDFSQKFDVGLLTGDVSLRQEASCLIMTTEILRSMLYRGADLIRDVEWVIFDEVHYVNDAERGVVWEEVIIMLPRHVNIVLLSATVPNTHEFADWIERTKQKKIRVTGTTKRPVPLEHCLFYSGELYKVCEDEKFLGLKAVKEAFKKSNLHTGTDGRSAPWPQNVARGRSEHSKGAKQNKHFNSSNLGGSVGNSGSNTSSSDSKNNMGSRKEASLWLQLVNKLSKKSLLPVVIFCFSKNRCDKSAYNMHGSDFTTSSEKSAIRLFCDKAFSRLKGSDRHLPQIVRVQTLLQRGIGVHHAGLLPIVKEVVEMLFCRGVIKVLFSTETFAMGVNAPARTVVFDSLRKFDGKEFRQLLPGEYTQMAGRAGRRGLDKIGTVIVMCRDEIPEERDLIHVLVGSATRLESQFRLTYIMIMHLLRVEELKVEDMLKRSFAEFHSQKKLPETQQQLMRKLATASKPIECIKGEPAIEEFYATSVESDALGKQILDAVLQSSSSQQLLTPGRVVLVKSQITQDPLLGVIIKAPFSKATTHSSKDIKQYVVLVIKLSSNDPPTKESDNPKKDEFSEGLVLIPKSKRLLDEEYTTSYSSRKSTGAINILLPYHGSSSGVKFEVKTIEINEFLSFCKDKIKIDQVRLLEDGNSAAMSNTVQQLLQLNNYSPALDPVKDLKWKDLSLVDLYNQWTTTLHKLTLNKCHGCIRLADHFSIAKDIRKQKDDIENLKFLMSDEALQQMPDFQGRIDVLKELGCIDSDLVVQMKGRVACEMNSGEELICTECFFENQFKDLEAEEAVAIMSAFVFQQRKTSEPNLTPTLAEAKKRLYTTALKLGELQSRCNVQIDPKEYAEENLKFGLVEVVYEWAKGTPFAEICDLTDVPEGLIVRTIVRLDETCREFKNAAAIMGNSSMFNKMQLASNAIKRDIVFAASLYVTAVE